jgi:hypothetical protein
MQPKRQIVKQIRLLNPFVDKPDIVEVLLDLVSKVFELLLV